MFSLKQYLYRIHYSPYLVTYSIIYLSRLGRISSSAEKHNPPRLFFNLHHLSVQGNSSKFLIYTVGFIIPFVTLGVANLAMYIKVQSINNFFSNCTMMNVPCKIVKYSMKMEIKNLTTTICRNCVFFFMLLKIVSSEYTTAKMLVSF